MTLNHLSTDCHLSIENICQESHICETYHKHLNKNEILRQVVHSNMGLDPIPEELKNFLKNRKSLDLHKKHYFLSQFVHTLYTKRLLI